MFLYNSMAATVCSSLNGEKKISVDSHSRPRVAYILAILITITDQQYIYKFYYIQIGGELTNQLARRHPWQQGKGKKERLWPASQPKTIYSLDPAEIKEQFKQLHHTSLWLFDSNMHIQYINIYSYIVIMFCMYVFILCISLTCA